MKKKMTMGMMFLWLALSILNIVTQPEYIQTEDSQKTEETSDSQPESLVLKAKEAVQFNFNLNLEFQSFLLDVVELDDEDNDLMPSDSSFWDNLTRKIGILFKRIILRNAP